MTRAVVIHPLSIPVGQPDRIFHPIERPSNP